MTIIRRTVTLLITAILLTGCSLLHIIKFQSKEESVAKEVLIFSKGETINGLTLQQDYEICGDLVCLASLIDGAAPYYITNGAKEILFCEFRNQREKDEISAEIYKTSTQREAQNFFINSSSLSPVDMQIAGNSARIDEGLVGTYRIETYKANYFIRLMTSRKDEKAKKEISEFAKSVLNVITD